MAQHCIMLARPDWRRLVKKEACFLFGGLKSSFVIVACGVPPVGLISGVQCSTTTTELVGLWGCILVGVYYSVLYSFGAVI